MQWRRQKRVTHVIGSSNHVLLLARYQDAPPGEEDEEEGLRKDYVKSQDKEANAHTFDRNGQSGYKPRRAGGTIGTGGSTSGYASSGSRSQRDEGSGSPSQPKIIFNEDEYTRITTPRQDVLFKKGYLSRKKPWTSGNASTSATPSTTESQSASHSTADGSETTEDQQLLDRDSATGEYPPVVEPGAQLGYGTFYDHASGYYYEYPVMLVGPAPVPAQVGPSVLAAVPCGPVPLRPIEWVNPAFVPKLANQPYCMMDYQANHSIETVTIMEENGTVVAVEASNGSWNESGTGSCSGSVAGETEEQAEETADNVKEQLAEEQQYPEQQQQQQHLEEQQQQHLENGCLTTAVDSYLDPLLMQETPPPPPSVHLSHVVSAVPQPYIYPGHYMFGPPLVNVNGVTIQSGPLVRTMDMSMTMACAKRRKKRKKPKQKRPILGNTEDEEEREYSSEYDNDVSSSRLPWSECPTTMTTTTTIATANRPLNPECQEFQLRPTLQSRVHSSPVSTFTVAEDITTINDSSNTLPLVVETELVTSREAEKICDIVSIVPSPTNREDAPTIHNSSKQLALMQMPSENANQSDVGRKPRNKKAQVNGRTNRPIEKTEAAITIETAIETRSRPPTVCEISSKSENIVNDSDLMNINTKYKLLKSNDNNVATESLNNHIEKNVTLTNGETNLERLGNSTERMNLSTLITPQADDMLPKKSCSTQATSNVSPTKTTNVNGTKDAQRLRHCNNPPTVRTTTSSLTQSKKYNKKGPKFVREPTPGPDLEDQAARLDAENGKVVQPFEQSSDLRVATVRIDHDATSDELCEKDRKMSCKEILTLVVCDSDDSKTKTMMSQDTIAGSNEDSGFESQTRLSDYPITNAVTEWLRRTNSPDVFLTSASTSDSEMDENDEEMDAESKNLQGNPMPALSANSGVDNDTNILLSRTASCGEFAKTNSKNNKIIDQIETTCASANGRFKREITSTMQRKASAKRIDKRNNRNVNERTQNQLVSSLITSHRLENLVTAVRYPLKSGIVGNVCEFTQEDSIAGMRVALNSRMNSKRASGRRAKISHRIDRDPVENINIRMRRIDFSGKNDGETIDDSTVNVRTFEKGEIIVSENGKLLPTSAYELVPSHDRGVSDTVKKIRAVAMVNEKSKMKNQRNDSGSSENDENDESVIMSSVSIEEPDVLECWEAETIEPIITPGKILQSSGILCEGEAAEEDNFEIQKITVEQHVRKYYTLARDSAASVEEEPDVLNIVRPVVTSIPVLKTVPNNPKKMIERIDLYNIEDIPIVVPDKNRDIILTDEKIPIDEAFEAYESCYTDGKSPFLTSFDSKLLKQQSLYGQNSEDPIPCRAVCCNIQ